MSALKSKRRRALPLLVMAIIVLSAMVSNGRLERVRGVDAVGIFGAGMCTGAALMLLLHLSRAESPSPK